MFDLSEYKSKSNVINVSAVRSLAIPVSVCLSIAECTLGLLCHRKAHRQESCVYVCVCVCVCECVCVCVCEGVPTWFDQRRADEESPSVSAAAAGTPAPAGILYCPTGSVRM